MNVSRSHLRPNLPMREVFEEDFKSLKPEALKTLNELLPKPSANANVIEITTSFYSGFMRWLSKFLGALHLELNAEDLDRCKLSRSEIDKITRIGESSGSLGSIGSSGSLSGSDSSDCLGRLEQIDPKYLGEDEDEDVEIGAADDGDKTDDDDVVITGF